MIDTHCHLTDPRLGDQLQAVIDRAAAAGVTRLITIGTDLDDSRAAAALCRHRDNVRCAVGIHPNYTQDARLEDVPQLRDIQANPGVAAMGEMGLDYFHKFADRQHQAKMFEAQLALAVEFARPVVIHSREAIDDTLAIMKHFPVPRAVFHCFTGTAAEADRILAGGHWISFTGPVTYKKNDALREVVKLVPADRLMVETDAPYLSPEPVRSQKTCEPAMVMHTARRVAEVRGLTIEELDRLTTGNAERFFNWQGAPSGPARATF
jgi:TatD DNase family protein